MAEMTREQKLQAVWRSTHTDYKGLYDGERAIMVYRQGTCLVRLNDLTDKEIEDRLPPHSREHAR